MIQIDWLSEQSYVLCNPRYSPEQQKRYQQLLIEAVAWPGHLWLATSGSTAIKWVGLSKQALLASAQAVNEHVQSTSSDCWIVALPFFHVGGLSIGARSYLSGAHLYNFNFKWQADQFYTYVEQVEGTLTALVPAQLYDLVQLAKPAPPSLRAVIIGGGRLLPELYVQAVKLGWKVMPSYGLTECASQVATAPLGCWEKEEYPALRVLPHLEAKESDGCLLFKGASLLSTYAYLEEKTTRLVDPKVEGWFTSEDRGRVEGQNLIILGRADAFIKIGGESVDLSRLEAHLQAICLELSCQEDMALVACPDARLGHVLSLAVKQGSLPAAQAVLARFQSSVLPFERIRQLHEVPFIPRSPLSKVLKRELITLIQCKYEDKFA